MMQQVFFIPGPLPGLNDMIDAAKEMGHVRRYSRRQYNGYATLKQQWGKLCTLAIEQAKRRPLTKLTQMTTPVEIIFVWSEEARRRDLDNIRTGAKFVLDALVKSEILKSDGWKQVRALRDEFLVDKHRPGVTVILREADATLAH